MVVINFAQPNFLVPGIDRGKAHCKMRLLAAFILISPTVVPASRHPAFLLPAMGANGTNELKQQRRAWLYQADAIWGVLFK